MPTFLSLAGTQAQYTHFARSLMPQLQGQAGDPDRGAFSEGGMNVYEPRAFQTSWPGPFYRARIELPLRHPETIARCASIKTSRYTYVRRPGGQNELYDRAEDPGETRNLIDYHAHAGTPPTGLVCNTTGVPPVDHDNGAEMPPWPLPAVQ